MLEVHIAQLSFIACLCVITKGFSIKRARTKFQSLNVCTNHIHKLSYPTHARIVCAQEMSRLCRVVLWFFENQKRKTAAINKGGIFFFFWKRFQSKTKGKEMKWPPPFVFAFIIWLLTSSTCLILNFKMTLEYSQRREVDFILRTITCVLIVIMFGCKRPPLQTCIGWAMSCKPSSIPPLCSYWPTWSIHLFLTYNCPLAERNWPT